MVQGKETLTYEQIAEIRNNINNIADQMNSELEEAKKIIESCQNEGIFVTDKGSVTMQEQFNQLAASFGPFIEKLKAYSDFLTNELNVSYSNTDQELANVWQNVSEAFSEFSNN